MPSPHPPTRSEDVHMGILLASRIMLMHDVISAGMRTPTTLTTCGQWSITSIS